MNLNRHGLPILPVGVSAAKVKQERLDAIHERYVGVMMAQILKIRDPEKRRRALKDFQSQTNN